MVKFTCRHGVARMALWTLAVIGAIARVELAAQSSSANWIRHSGFEGLKQGVAGDSGANLYVSARGRLQTINRWDLNRDGELDLLFTQDHNSVYTPDSLIYWGGDDGYRSLLPEMWKLRAPFSLLGYVEQASSRISRLPSAGGGRCQIADLNLDGYLDIVFGNYMHNYRTDQAAYIYWGSAQGFKATNRLELPALLAGGVAVGDLNGDGLPEVVLANHGDEVGEHHEYGRHLESYIYWGNLNGYEVSRRSSIPTISAADVAVGDFNGDGSPDLAFLNSNRQEQSVFVYRGDGKGDFGERRRQVLSRAEMRLSAVVKGSSTGSAAMKTLLAAELNGDKFTDLVVGGTSHAVVFSGSARGLEAEGTVDLPAKNCTGMDAADLNRDGHVDLILANEGTDQEAPPPSSIYWGSAQGYSAERRLDLPTYGAAAVKVADLNQDGLLDILFGNAHDFESQDVPSYIYWGGANGFASHLRTDLQGFGVIGCGVADLNRDGKPDILLVSHVSGSGVLPSPIFWGNRDHYYSSASVSLLEPGGNMKYSVADLDDDGYPDIVFLQEKKTFVWWGSPAGYKKENRTCLPFESPLSHCVADLNRDGHLDIILVVVAAPGDKRARALIVWGNADRLQGVRTSELQLSGPILESNMVADLNKDGYLDLIFPVCGCENSEIWWGSSEGYKPEKVTQLRTHDPPHALAADLDADGWLDVVFTSGRTVSQSADLQGIIYWGGPEGYSAKAQTRFEGFTSLDATVADLNRDGHLDLAITNYKSDVTRELPAMIYWGDGSRNFGNGRRTLLEAHSSSAIDSLDLNRDGWVDLVVSNHQRYFDHAESGTYIYWGSDRGFSPLNRKQVPTIGVHLDAMVDAGNIYTRKYEWHYVSPPIEAPKNTSFARMEWKAETEFETGVKFQVRSASTRDGLEKAAWSGPAGATSFYTSSGARLTSPGREHGWLEYRAVLFSPDGGNSPLLTEVAVECVPR